MILVTGATGNVGGEVVRRLVAGGHPVRALTREPARAAARFGAGVELVRGDLTAPHQAGATLEAALAGVESAFLLADAMDLPEVTRHFVAAAKQAGVRHIVLNSSGTIAMDPPTVIGNWHLGAEEELKGSGIAWTMLRPGNFATNTLRWAGTIRAQGAVYNAVGGGVSAPVDPRDIGAVAACALTDASHRGQTHYVTGPQSMSVHEQVEVIGQAIGKTLRVIEVPVAGARMGMVKSGMPEVMADAILELTHGARRHTEPLVNDTVQRVTGRAARSFAEWVTDHVGEFA